MEELKNNPDVDRLVGHSLGSSVLQEINNRHGNSSATTVYSSPFVSGSYQQKNQRYLRFRNRGDPIAMFDDAAITGEIKSNNLLDKHGFNNVTGQGMTKLILLRQFLMGLTLIQHRNNKYIYIYITYI